MPLACRQAAGRVRRQMPGLPVRPQSRRQAFGQPGAERPVFKAASSTSGTICGIHGAEPLVPKRPVRRVSRPINGGPAAVRAHRQAVIMHFGANPQPVAGRKAPCAASHGAVGIGGMPQGEAHARFHEDSAPPHGRRSAGAATPSTSSPGATRRCGVPARGPIPWMPARCDASPCWTRAQARQRPGLSPPARTRGPWGRECSAKHLPVLRPGSPPTGHRTCRTSVRITTSDRALPCSVSVSMLKRHRSPVDVMTSRSSTSAAHAIRCLA